jgi:DNA-binding helix-hairpin-helix protein with protein kinase domain/sugar lactone lactonase YvrE
MEFYDMHRRVLTLGSELARGGEAAIHPVQGQPHLVAKIYFTPAAGYDQKLAHMVAHPPADPERKRGRISIAWPVSLLFDGSGQFVGYLMPYVQYTTKLLTVFNPTLRAKMLPSFNRRYLHRAARNLAVTIRAIHQEGYVVGDINESNILVADTALITIIDTDSFQVQAQGQAQILTFPCQVGKGEYTPPELQGTSFETTIRHPENDHFGLGVLIFQMLMYGNHPFRGKWLQSGEPPTIEAKIAQGLFPYGGQAGRGKVSPPPNVTLDILHPRVSDLVQRCFVDGHSNPRQRPTPDEWDDALGEAEQALVQCRNGHYYEKHRRACPTCGALTGKAQTALSPASSFQKPPASPVNTSQVLAQEPPEYRGLSSGIKANLTKMKNQGASLGEIQYYLMAHSPLKKSQVQQVADWVMASVEAVPAASPRPPKQPMPATTTPPPGQPAPVPASPPARPMKSMPQTPPQHAATQPKTRKAQSGCYWWLLVAGVSIFVLMLVLVFAMVWPAYLLEVRTFRSVSSVAFALDGQTLATGSFDDRVRLWDAASGDLLRTLEGHTDYVLSMAFAPDGQTLASASADRTVRLWDVASGELLRTLEGHPYSVESVAFAPDGQTLASASWDEVRLWDAASGNLLRTLEGHNGLVESVAVAPDGQMLASAACGQRDEDRRRCIQGEIILWDAASGNLLRTLEGHTDWVNSVAFAPDGQTFASASGDRTVRLWDVASGELLRTLEGHNGRVGSVAFAPDGQTLASGSYDETVRLWDAASGDLLRILEGHTYRVGSVAFAPDGQTLASTSWDDTVWLWDVESGDLLLTMEGWLPWKPGYTD